MSLLGNILWIFFGGGIVIFIEYLIGGLVLCATIVGIPFGIQCFKLAGLALIPFGRDVTPTESASGCLAILMNVLWIVAGGIWVAVSHLGFALLCAITVIGLPFAVQHLKLAKLSLTPFGYTVS